MRSSSTSRLAGWLLAIATGAGTLVGCSSGAPKPLEQAPGATLPRWATERDRSTEIYQTPNDSAAGTAGPNDRSEADDEPPVDQSEIDGVADADTTAADAAGETGTDSASSGEPAESASEPREATSGLPGAADGPRGVEVTRRTQAPLVVPRSVSAIGVAAIDASATTPDPAAATDRARASASESLQIALEVMVRRALIRYVDTTALITDDDRRVLRGRVWYAELGRAFQGIPISHSEPGIDRNEAGDPVAVMVEAETPFSPLAVRLIAIAELIFEEDLVPPSESLAVRLLAAYR